MDFQSLKNSVNNAITNNLNNYTVGTKKIVLNKLTIDDKNIDQLMSWSNMQKVKNKNRSLTVPIYADITLKDNNKIVSTGKHINIGQLPLQTKNDSFLVNGIEYIVPLQLRRDPGVYTSLSENGMFVSAINSSKGRNYKIELDPNTNVQKINIDGTKIPLLPILNKLGFKKDQIIKTWGGDNNAKMLYEINEVASNTSQGKKALEKLYKKLEYNAKPNATEAEMLLAVNEYLKNKTAFNPIVNKVTLGKPYSTLSPAAILDVSKKLFDISGKKADFDDTENLLFKHVKLPYDLVEEKINQDFKKKLTASLNRNLKNFNSVKDIIRPGLFTKSLKSFFNESQISEPSEMVNPLHILSTRDKITLKGEGGITDEHTVSMGMKSLHPSYFGFIDPLHTPDGSAGLVNHLSQGASVLRSNGKLTNQFYDMKTGKIKIFSVADVYNKRIGKPDQYYIEPGKRPKPRFKKIKVFIGNKSEEVSPDKVDLVLAHGSYVYDPSTNLVPFINSSSGNRISMAGKHSEQTISLIAREAPLVSTLTRNKREFVKAMGERASILSPVDGQIRKITSNEIFIQDKKKKIHKVELRKNFELNQESFFTDEPIVSLGQKVKKGELIAQNNWIDKKGNLALGINAKVGYFPYKGYNIEDGVVISEDFAKKLTSQHLHVQDLKIKKGDLNLSKFKLNFKNKYTPENFSKLDSDGVVTKGSTVTQGNILIAHAIPFEVSEEDKILGKLSKGFKKRLRDQSVVWNYDFPGKVVDVIKSENLIKVKVLSEQPAQVTDKLAGKFGNKGIISNIVPNNEMPHTVDGEPLEVIMNIHGVACFKPSGLIYTKRGWVKAKNLKLTDELLCLINGKSEWHKPEALHKYDYNGYLYGYKSTMYKYIVTGNHELHTRTRKTLTYKKEYAKDAYDKIRFHKAVAEFKTRSYNTDETITIPKFSNQKKSVNTFDLLAFAEFLGYFISEGHTVFTIENDKNSSKHYKTVITQIKIKERDIIEKCLEKLNVAFYKTKTEFIISNRNIFEYCRVLGKSYEKFIPEECFSWPKEALEKLFESLVLGDGNIDSSNYIRYTTSSKKLSIDFEKLAIYLGYNANTVEKKKENIKPYYSKKINKTFYARHNCYVIKLTSKKEFGQHTHGYKRNINTKSFTKKYNGKVFCPTVPGGLVYYKEKNYRPIWIHQSRINPSQLYEAALGKIAKKTGKKYLIDNFGHDNNWEYVDNELKKHNIHANETVIDPVTNKELKSWNPSTNKFENPFVGVGYINKSVHQTRKKFDARSRGTYSTIDMPSKNPEASHYMGNSASKQNPKSVDRLTLYSLLANGSKDVIRDMFVNKGQRRDDVWDAIINGSSLPPPKISTATQKFLALLKAAGVNSERKGRFISNPVLTDKDTLKMSSGKIPKPNQFLRGKDLMPIRGGMFDPILTGGTENSTRYNHIDLNTKIPNPITKNAIKILLDLTESEFSDILSGKKNMQGLTGASFFEKKLKEIDPKAELAKIESQKINAPKSKINILNRKLRYLRALVNNNIKPEEYMISKLPIIPSKFRPILQLPNGTIEPAPINNLYRDVALATKLANEKSFPKFLKNDATHELYNTVSGLIGVTEPTVNTQNSLIKARNIKSVLTEIGGSGSPKGGFLHSKILAKTQDLIGNSVIAIGPDLGIDEIGIPFKMAETIYEPWILNKLKNMGQKISNVDYRLLKEKNPALIKNILNQLVKERPVIVNRNPSLHKGSIMAFNPVLITGDAIKLNPLILKPFNADFDGDQMPVHVPISNDAVKQAYKMIPSLNYYDPKNDLSNINFDQEYVAGISLMTENGRKTNYSYKTLDEAKEAYKKNEIRINDFIKVGGKENTLGRLELSEIIPKELGISVNRVFTNADIKKMLNSLEKDGSITKYTDFVNKLKDAAAKYSYDEGFSFSLDDIKPRKDIRSKILSPAISLINKAKTEDAKKSIIKQYAGNAQKFLVNDVNKQHNRFFLPASYGSRKISPDVMQQITVTPFYAAGMKDKLIDTPIGKSYSEGLDIHDNFLMAYGARKALVDKVSSVQDPGVLTKELIGSFSGVNISANDCGTTDGVYVDITDTFNLQGRVLAEKTNGVSAGTVLDAKALVDLRKGKDTRVKVRSPLTCKMPNGICARCYGWNEYQQFPKIGYPAGIQAAQSIGETGTQSALSSHHLGGTVSGGSFRSGFDMTKFLLHMPENVKNKATLSQVEGTVTSIKKGVNNQHIIIIDTDPNPYIVRNELLVKTGDKVKKGQALDNGTIKLQELADLVPMNKVQNFLTTELEKSYSGTKILRRNTETIVKGVTGYSKVSNPGKSPYLEEQVVPNNLIEAIRNNKPILTEDAIGWQLDESVGGYKKGDIITIDIANDLLDKKGIKYVRVNGDGLRVKNQLIGIHSIPLVQPDLLKKMSFQRIKAALKEGPISGEYSNVHGMFPEPALTVATEFGMPGYDYY